MTNLRQFGLFLALLWLSGCATEQVAVRLHEQVSSVLPEGRYREADLPFLDLRIPVDPHASLSEKYVQKAEIYPTAGGDAILLQFDLQGALRLDELTTRCRGKYLVVYINQRPVSAWLVDRRLTNGQLLVEGDFTEEEARHWVELLNTAAKKRGSGGYW